MTFVLFHGSFNSYYQIKEYWYPKLNLLKQKILFPKFPIDTLKEITENGIGAPLKKQSLKSWLAVFDSYYHEIKNMKDLVFVGHSTGPLFILHVLLKYKIKVNCAVFISPFLDPLVKPVWQVKLVNQSYYSNNFDFKLLQNLCPISYTLYGINDPYVETKNTLLFAKKMRSKIVPIKEGGHLNTEETSHFVIDQCKSIIKSAT